jgi:hypothetical protein
MLAAHALAHPRMSAVHSVQTPFVANQYGASATARTREF